MRRSGCDALHHRKSPRVRGTPGVQRTHGPRHVATPKQNGDPPRPPPNCRERKSARPSTSRARCLRFAPRDPRWAEFSEPLRYCGLTGPTHRCEPRQHLAVGTELRRCHQEARDANSSRRDRAAWTSGLGVRICTSRRGHRIPLRVRDADQTPSGGAGHSQGYVRHCGIIMIIILLPRTSSAGHIVGLSHSALPKSQRQGTSVAAPPRAGRTLSAKDLGLARRRLPSTAKPRHAPVQVCPAPRFNVKEITTWLRDPRSRSPKRPRPKTRQRRRTSASRKKPATTGSRSTGRPRRST